MLHLSRVITIQDRRKRSWKEAMKLEHRTPGYKAYPQSSTAEPSWRCSVISPGENILTIRQNADRVTAVFWYSRWEGEPRSARIFTHCQSLDCQNLQKEKHIDEISYSGIRSGIFTGSALWRSLFSAPSHPGNRLADSEDQKRHCEQAIHRAIRPRERGWSADRENFWWWSFYCLRECCRH